MCRSTSAIKHGLVNLCQTLHRGRDGAADASRIEGVQLQQRGGGCAPGPGLTADPDCTYFAMVCLSKHVHPALLASRSFPEYSAASMCHCNQAPASELLERVHVRRIQLVCHRPGRQEGLRPFLAVDGPCLHQCQRQCLATAVPPGSHAPRVGAGYLADRTCGLPQLHGLCLVVV